DKGALPGAHVLPLCGQSGSGVACDVNGYYSLDIKSKICTVRFQFLGFETVEKTVSFQGSNEITLDVPMKSTETRLTGIEVKEKRYEIKKDESVSSLELIPAKHIEDNNITKLDAAFDKVGGLVIVNNEPQMRGGSGFSSGMGSRVMIMMDEMPVLRVDAGRPAWNLIPMENIEQIEVLKGASSVLYGSAAITGAINVRTAYPKHKPETRFILYNGFYSRPKADYRCSWPKGTVPLTYGGSLSHARKIKKLDLVLSVEYAHDDGFVGQETSVDSTLQNPELYKKILKEQRIRFNFGTRYRIKEGVTAGLNGNFLYSQNTMTHFWLNADSGMYRTFPGSLTEITDFMFFLDPFFKYYGKNDVSHTVKGRFMYSDNWATHDQDSKSEMYYLEYQYAKRFKKAGALQLFVGAVGQMARTSGNIFTMVGDTTGILKPKYSANGAIYVQLEKKFLKKKNLTILGGARYEYFQIFEEFGHLLQDSASGNYVEAKPVFRAGINYQIVRTFTSFRASFGQGYRFPTIGERYITTRVGNYGFYPNPDLKSETSWNVELGVQQMFKLLGIQGFIDIAWYYQRYNNYVEFFLGPWLTAEQEFEVLKRYGFKFFNTGEARIVGVDLSVAGEAKMGNHLKYSFYFAYTYSNPKVLDTSYVFTETSSKDYNYTNTSSNATNQIMKYRLEHVLKVDLDFTFFDCFTVGASTQYYSLMKNVDGFFYTLDRFSSVAPRYVVTSSSPFPFDGLEHYRETHRTGTWIFGLRTSVEMWNVKLSVIVSNLFNREYSLRPMAPEAPRITTVQLLYKFTEGEPFFPLKKKNS
ncbi:MAG: TonB-dependent receptor, partial [Bacteroidales bacterium]|nr:TonB-dependent receptor [Bacteroidales bacterium]